jgi:hypothetical protein
MHKHVNGFTLNPQTLRKQEEMENPPLGEFSILVLAATVAHHMDVVNPPKIWASAILNQPEWSVQAPEAAAATSQSSNTHRELLSCQETRRFAFLRIFSRKENCFVGYAHFSVCVLECPSLYVEQV